MMIQIFREQQGLKITRHIQCIFPHHIQGNSSSEVFSLSIIQAFVIAARKL
jgi:hypothetical protein